jgi:hypothetical protein
MQTTTNTAAIEPPGRLAATRRWLASLSTWQKLSLAFLGAVIAAGVVWRLYFSINHRDFTGADQKFYSGLARSLAYHLNYQIDYAHDIFHWAPGAPASMAFGLRLFGQGDSGLRGAYVIQLLASLGSMGVLFLLARRFANIWAALGATAVLAICTGALTTMGDLITEPLGSLALLLAAGALVFAVADPTGRRHSVRWAVVSGAVMAIAVLTRPDFLPLPVIWAAVVLLAGSAPWRQRIEVAAAVAITCFAVMAPYCVWASNKAGQLVTPTTSGKTTYWVGTYLPGNGQTMLARKKMAPEIHKAYPQTRHQNYPSANFMILTIRKRYDPSLSKDEAMGKALRQNIEDYAFGEPWAFTKMMIKKPFQMWNRPYKGHGRERTLVGNLLNWPAMIGALLAVIGALYFRRRNFGLLLVGVTLIAGTAVASIGPAIPRANARFVPLALLGAALAADMFVRQRRAARAQPATPTEV